MPTDVFPDTIQDSPGQGHFPYRHYGGDPSVLGGRFSTWVLDATLFTLRAGNGLVIKLPELPALPSAEGSPGISTCISNYDPLQCNLSLPKVKMSTFLRSMAILFGKEEFPD